MKRRDFFNSCLGGLAGMNIFFSSGKHRLSLKDSKKEGEETNVLVKVLGTAQDGNGFNL